MKITWISIADTHLKLTDSMGKIHNKFNTRLKDKLDSMVTAVKFAVEEKVNFVVLLGDVFHSFNPHEKLRELFICAVQDLIKANIPIIWIIGNHETDMKSFNFAATGKLLNLFSGNNKLQIISKHTVMKKYGYSFSFIPATYTEHQIIEELRSVKSPKTIVFGHWATQQAVLGKEEFQYRKGISHTNYEGFKQVYLGDFHKYQRYDNWMYIGSLNKSTFSEVADVKGFVHSKLDTDTDELSNEFIAVPDRLFLELFFNECDEPPSMSKVKDAIVKVHFSGKKTWFYALDRNQIIYDLYHQGAHKVFTAFTNQDNNETTETEITVSSNFTDDIGVFFKAKPHLVKPAIKFLYR